MSKTGRICCLIVFWVYVFCLLQSALFQFSVDEIIDSFVHWSPKAVYAQLKVSNFLPFLGAASLRGYLYGCILAFLPFGLCLPLLFFRRPGPFKVLTITLFLSLLTEAIPFFAGLAPFDVNAVLFSMFGALLGYWIFAIWRHYWPQVQFLISKHPSPEERDKYEDDDYDNYDEEQPWRR